MSAEDDGGGAGRDSDIENAENGQAQPGSAQGGKAKASKEGGSKPGAAGDADAKAETKTWDHALLLLRKKHFDLFCAFVCILIWLNEKWRLNWIAAQCSGQQRERRTVGSHEASCHTQQEAGYAGPGGHCHLRRASGKAHTHGKKIHYHSL
jgi:hypothetical protein